VAGTNLANGPTVGGTTLPRTGPAIDPGLLLMLGGALVIAGVLMVRYAPQEA
jgi:LPXTG-motif cell wall-anchored protein